MNPQCRSDHERRQYWESRAQRYARQGDGLAAVCSYGMPAFYNRYTDALQRRALAPWLAVAPGTTVLELGCGIGRWTREFARRGASVVGLDLSPTMIAEARLRASADRLSASRCRYLVADVTAFSLRQRFAFIFGVTVLQHVVDPSLFHQAVDCVSAHLAPGGRAVFLEVAPTMVTGRCDHSAFVARDEDTYRAVFQRSGLSIETVCEVDPAPFRLRLLPKYRALPRAVAVTAMAIATAASIPVDLAPRRSHRSTSWHKVFVLGRREPPHQAGVVQ